MRVTKRLANQCLDVLLQVPAIQCLDLPYVLDIEFKLTRCQVTHGWLQEEDEWYVIELSTVVNKTIQDVLATVSHELIHLHLIRSGLEDWDEHGEDFNNVAMTIEKELGFNIR